MIRFLTYSPAEELIVFDMESALRPLGLSHRTVERWLRSVGADYGFSVGNLTYILCSDERELQVNREFLGHDYYTDVITFDYTTPSSLNGDIFISTDTVRSNAEQIGVSYEQELCRILIHGLLHLTGQGDKTPETKAEMTRKEDLALSKLFPSLSK